MVLGGRNGALIQRRIGIVAICTAAMCGALILRLGWLQIVRGPSLSAAAYNEHEKIVPIPAQRGEIIDRNGDVLALSVPAATITADPKLIQKAAASAATSVTTVSANIQTPASDAAALANVLNLSSAQILTLLEKPIQWVTLEGDATPAQAAAVKQLKLVGIYTQAISVREYPYGTFLAQTLGFVGADGQGLEGVERSYNRELEGKAGAMATAVDAFGKPIPYTTTKITEPVNGDTLQLTIDGGLQYDLQDLLQEQVARTGATAAFAIVMQPSTGAILAWGAWPSFDPNNFSASNPATYANPLVNDAYPPGSVFKPITVGAALSAGVVTPTTQFVDPGVCIVDGVHIHNFQQLLVHTTFLQAFEESANVIFCKVAQELGAPTFYRYLHLFGLFSPTGIDVPVANPTGTNNQIIPENQLTTVGLAEESFGQSIAITPLSLITAINVVADGGVLMRPHVGLDLITPTGRKIPIQPVDEGRVLSPSIDATERQMMENIVTDGTGERAFIPCYDVAGKTGTANLYINGQTSPDVLASFVAYAPASNPQAIVLVQLYNPAPPFNEGGEIAAPLAQALLADALHVLGVPPHCTATNSVTPAPGSPGTTPLILNMVPMPAITTETPAEAAAQLYRIGLYLQVSGTGSTILRQYPPAGADVQKYTKVDGYTEPTEPAPPSDIAVPNVLGDTIAQATSTLTQDGLALDTSGVGIAISQTPTAGTELPPGTGVSVTFASSG